MMPPESQPHPPPPPQHGRRTRSDSSERSGVRRLGCVSFLNAKPLIDGIEHVGEIGAGGEPPRVHFDVPAGLLQSLEGGEVDLALCPVIDYHRAAQPLMIVPVGGICCDGPTFTVRLFSQIPIERITTLHIDTDSHTSVALARVLLHEMYGLRPRLINYQPAPRRATPSDSTNAFAPPPEAMLLIGDKVVTQSPRAIEYPCQLDLGEAWKRLTGLPFCFATWLGRADAQLGELPRQLERLRDHNRGRIDPIVARYATPHHWPTHLAQRYLSSILRYRVGPRELEAIDRFGALAAKLGVIDRQRPLNLWNSNDGGG